VQPPDPKKAPGYDFQYITGANRKSPENTTTPTTPPKASLRLRLMPRGLPYGCNSSASENAPFSTLPPLDVWMTASTGGTIRPADRQLDRTLQVSLDAPPPGPRAPGALSRPVAVPVYPHREPVQARAEANRIAETRLPMYVGDTQ
jgi:hypothetical protein